MEKNLKFQSILLVTRKLISLSMISSILVAEQTLNSRYLQMTLFPARTVSWKLIRQEHFF